MIEIRIIIADGMIRGDSLVEGKVDERDLKLLRGHIESLGGKKSLAADLARNSLAKGQKQAGEHAV